MNLTPAFRKVGNLIARDNRRAMATRGASIGSPWKPLAESTHRDKARHGWSRSPLVRTGDMRRSFIGRPMNIEVYSPRSARYGTALRTAVWQQFGTRRHGRRHIPPRTIMKVTRHQLADFRKMVAEYVVKGKER